MYLAWCAHGIIVSNSILCCASFREILFRSLNVHAKTSLNSLNNFSTSRTLPISNYALIFTIYGITLVPRLSFINYWSLVNIHPTICNSCAFIFVGVSSTMQHSLVDDYSTSSNTPYLPKLFLAHIYCQLSSFLCSLFQILVLNH